MLETCQSDSSRVCGRRQSWLHVTSTTTIATSTTTKTTTTDLVTECGVVERVQLVGDVLANEVPEHLIEKSIGLQEVGESLSGPTQELAVLLGHDGHLRKTPSAVFAFEEGKFVRSTFLVDLLLVFLLQPERPAEGTTRPAVIGVSREENTN